MTTKKRKVAWEDVGISPMARLRIQLWLDDLAQNVVLDYYGQIADIQSEQLVIIDDQLCVEVGIKLDSGEFISHRLTLTPDEWFLAEN